MSKYKISITTLVLTILVTGCSLTRRTGGSTAQYPGKTEKQDIKMACLSNNLSGKDFVISRIKVKYASKTENRTVTGFLKHTSNGEILLSLRSVAGIEVARILFTGDSIKVYDKINYILYIQNVKYLEKKYGIPADALPLIWGDIPEILNEKLNINENSSDLFTDIVVGEKRYRVEFNRQYSKIGSAEIYQDNQNSVSIKHSDFVISGDLVYPGLTIIEDRQKNMRMEIIFSGVKKEKIKNMRFNTMNIIETKVLR